MKKQSLPVKKIEKLKNIIIHDNMWKQIAGEDDIKILTDKINEIIDTINKVPKGE